MGHRVVFVLPVACLVPGWWGTYRRPRSCSGALSADAGRGPGSLPPANPGTMHMTRVARDSGAVSSGPWRSAGPRGRRLLLGQVVLGAVCWRYVICCPSTPALGRGRAQGSCISSAWRRPHDGMSLPAETESSCGLGAAHLVKCASPAFWCAPQRTKEPPLRAMRDSMHPPFHPTGSAGARRTLSVSAFAQTH